MLRWSRRDTLRDRIIVLPRLRPRALLVAAALCLAALGGCASGETRAPASASSSGGAGGGGGARSASSATSSSGGGATSVCGDGIAEAGEDCDGGDFAGKTCADYGYSGGALVCNAACHVVGKDCIPRETCGDGEDDDGDGAIDCDDPDCAAAAPCVDPCSAAVIASFDQSFDVPSLDGRSSALASSCAAPGSRAIVFEVFVPAEGDLLIFASGNDDLAIAVRSDCASAASEVACQNATASGLEKLRIHHVMTGDRYHVLVHGSGGQPSVSLVLVNWEESCVDLFDDEYDGLLDCDDPDCQGSAACVPGEGEVGAPCTHHNECASKLQHPLCLSDALGYPGGSCSEFCDLAQDDCPSGAACVDVGLPTHGACLHACLTSDDCRAGYPCADAGAATMVCVKP